MQITPTYSIKPTVQEQSPYSPDQLESLALQFSMAQGSVSPDQMNLNRTRLSFGDEQRMRMELQQKAEQESKGIATSTLDSALSEGNVDLAQQVVTQGIPKETNMVMENYAADFAATVKDSDPAEVVRPEDIGSDIRKNARLLRLNNAFNEITRELESKYVPKDQADIQPLAVGPQGEPIYTDVAMYRQTIDLLKTFVNSIYAGAKSGVSSFFFFPGTKSEVNADQLWDPAISDEEFGKRLDTLMQSIRDSFLDKGALDNPLQAMSMLRDMISTSQLDKPEFQELLAIKGVIDEQGQVQENILGKSFDPASTVDQVFSNKTFQNFIDNPLFDIPLALSSVDLIKATMGSTTAGRLLANQIQGGKVTAQNFRYRTQMNYPGGIQNPELLSIVQRQMVEPLAEGLEKAVDPLRVKGSAAQISAEQQRIQRTEFPGKNLAYFEHVVEGPNQFMAVNIQSRAGIPFYTEQSARQAGNAQGLSNFKVIPNARGNGWLIQIRRGIDESGWMDTTITKDANWIDNIFGIGKYAWSPKRTGTKSQLRGATSAALETSEYAKNYSRLYKFWEALGGDELDKVQELMLKGMRTPNPSDPTGRTLGKWFDEPEIDQHYISVYGRQASLEEKSAYYAYRAAYDLDYELMNKRQYDNAAAAGLSHYTVDDIAGIDDFLLARAVDNRAAISENARFVLSNGMVVDKAGAAAELADKSNTVLRLYGRMDYAGQEVTHIIQKYSKVKSSGLNPYVLGYAEGGARRYAEKWLVKQSMGDASPSVHAIFPSEAHAMKYAEQMTQIQAKYNDYQRAITRLGANANQVQLNALRRQYDADIHAIHDGYTLQRVQQEIADGKFSRDGKFNSVFDREDLPMKGIAENEQVLQLNQYKGKLYYSKRGEHLTDGYVGNYAELVPPFEALAQQMTHASRMAGYSNFAIKEVNSWMAKYGKWLRLDDPNVRFPTPEQLFRDGVWLKNPEGISNNVLQVAQAQRMHILRELRHPDALGAKVMEKKLSLAKGMARLLGDKDYLRWLPKAVQRGTIVTESDALNFMKTVTYSLTMGLGNFGHFVLQALSLKDAVLKSPIYGTFAFKDAPFIVMASLGDFNNKLVKVLDTRAATALGYYKKGEFTEVLYDWQRTGWKEVGTTEATLDTTKIVSALPTSRPKQIVIKQIDKLVHPLVRFLRETEQAGRVPTYKGEEFFRATSFGIARREALDKAAKGVFPKGSDEYIEWIRGRTNELMSHTSPGASAFWQRNEATGLFMQMRQYGWKMSEDMLFFSRDITTGERFRLIIGNIALFGAAGYPFGQQIADAIYSLTGRKPDMEEIKDVYLGGLDSFMRNVMEQDTAFAARMGNGQSLYMIYDALLGDNAKPMTAFLGVSATTVKNINDKFGMIGQILQGTRMKELELTPVLYASDLVSAQLAELAGSTSNLTKAYMAHKYGLVMNKAQDSISARNDSSYSTLLRLLGIETASKSLLYKFDKDSKQHDQVLWDLSRIAAEYRIQVSLALADKDYAKKDLLEKGYSTFMATIDDPDDRAEVLSRATSNLLNDDNTRRIKDRNLTPGN